MSLFPDLAKTLGVESLDPDLAKKLQPLLEHLAANFTALRNGLAKLNFADNIECEVAQASFTHAVPLNLKLSKLTQAKGALVLSCLGAVPLGVPDVAMVGKQQAAVTVWFLNSASASIPMTLLLLAQGGRSSQT